MRLLASLASVLLVTGSLGAQAVSALDARLLRIREHYDSSFAALIAKVDTSDAHVRVLRDLARFKDQHVGWAREQNGRMFTLVASRASAWLVVVPPEDPAFARMGSVMERDEGATVPAVRIKPELISPTWAGVFLTFELSGLADEVLGVMPPSPTSADYMSASLRAYGLEYRAALVAGGRRYAAHLDSLLIALAPATAKELAERAPSSIPTHFDALDAHFGAVKALSVIEEQRRAGVFVISLLFRYAEANRISAGTLGAAIRCAGGCAP